MRSIWITLGPQQIACADEIARKRQGAAVLRQRPAHNGAPVDYERALSINVSGARCEMAGWKWLRPIKWHALAEDIGSLPDLGDFIDVKGISKSRHKLIVQKNDPPDWAYLLICSEQHPRYEIVGWLWGREAQQERYWGDPAGGRPAFFVNGPLRDCEELIELTRAYAA